MSAAHKISKKTSTKRKTRASRPRNLARDFVAPKGDICVAWGQPNIVVSISGTSDLLEGEGPVSAALWTGRTSLGIDGVRFYHTDDPTVGSSYDTSADPTGTLPPENVSNLVNALYQLHAAFLEIDTSGGGASAEDAQEGDLSGADGMDLAALIGMMGGDVDDDFGDDD